MLTRCMQKKAECRHFGRKIQEKTEYQVECKHTLRVHCAAILVILNEEWIKLLTQHFNMMYFIGPMAAQKSYDTIDSIYFLFCFFHFFSSIVFSSLPVFFSFSFILLIIRNENSHTRFAYHLD